MTMPKIKAEKPGKSAQKSFGSHRPRESQSNEELRNEIMSLRRKALDQARRTERRERVIKAALIKLEKAYELLGELFDEARKAEQEQADLNAPTEP